MVHSGKRNRTSKNLLLDMDFIMSINYLNSTIVRDFFSTLISFLVHEIFTFYLYDKASLNVSSFPPHAKGANPAANMGPKD